jgi:mannose-6-phosphate isomerase-like protein (cupin superfamily)
MRTLTLALLVLLGACASPALAQGPAMVVVHENDMRREEPAPYGASGATTAYRISDAAPNRTLEFRKRTLHVGAAIGLHVIGMDEIYYVVEGEGDVTSDGVTRRLTPGMAAYLYAGANVGIAQVGDTPLTIIVTYPLPAQSAR